MYIYLIILFVFVVVATYIIHNLNKKLEKTEDIIATQSELIANVTTVIEASDIKIKQLDERGSFSSDDEIGFFFNVCKEIQDDLNTFKELQT